MRVSGMVAGLGLVHRYGGQTRGQSIPVSRSLADVTPWGFSCHCHCLATLRVRIHDQNEGWSWGYSWGEGGLYPSEATVG